MSLGILLNSWKKQRWVSSRFACNMQVFATWYNVSLLKIIQMIPEKILTPDALLHKYWFKC